MNLTFFKTSALIDEVIDLTELETLLASGTPLKHYIGFEISGNPHIGSGLITMAVIKELQKVGVKTTIFLADWHSWINKKLGGDREFIKYVAENSFKHMMIAAGKAVGADTDNIEFILGSDLYAEHTEHWANLIEVSEHSTLARIKRSIDIMGRAEGEVVEFSKLIYPPLQVADIFTMQVNIAHAGTDQRKAHVLARQVAQKLQISPLKNNAGETIKPIAIHHKLLPGLATPPEWPLTPERAKQLITEMKMSKSKPDSAIFMNDTPEQIRAKVNKAFCPEGDLSYNPVMVWAEMLVFGLGNTLEIVRPEKWGGNLRFDTYKQLKETFLAKQLHPQDLKIAIAEYVISLLKPASDYIASVKTVGEVQDEITKRISR